MEWCPFLGTLEDFDAAGGTPVTTPVGGQLEANDSLPDVWIYKTESHTVVEVLHQPANYYDPGWKVYCYPLDMGIETAQATAVALWRLTAKEAS